MLSLLLFWRFLKKYSMSREDGCICSGFKRTNIICVICIIYIIMYAHESVRFHNYPHVGQMQVLPKHRRASNPTGCAGHRVPYRDWQIDVNRCCVVIMMCIWVDKGIFVLWYTLILGFVEYENLSTIVAVVRYLIDLDCQQTFFSLLSLWVSLYLWVELARSQKHLGSCLPPADRATPECICFGVLSVPERFHIIIFSLLFILSFENPHPTWCFSELLAVSTQCLISYVIYIWHMSDWQ